MIKVELKNKRHTPNTIIDTHDTYDIMIGDVKLGELVHRFSKKTYHVEFEKEFKMFDVEYFRQLVYIFDKTDIEDVFSEALKTIAKIVPSPKIFYPSHR